MTQTVQFSLHRQPAADCKLPVDAFQNFPLKDYPEWIVWHVWNKEECGQIRFPEAGRQLLTLQYEKGNNWLTLILYRWIDRKQIHLERAGKDARPVRPSHRSAVRLGSRKDSGLFSRFGTSGLVDWAGGFPHR
jgi:hypothetical protein